jgi:hypothetical protein
LIWAACAAFFIALFPSTSHAKTAVVVRGIFGAQIAPMTSIIKGLEKRGYKVEVREWWQGVPTGSYDVAVGHSAGDNPVLRSKSKKKRTIDPTFINVGCQSGECRNWHNPWDAFPFILCCGGYPVRNAKNIRAPIGHVRMPEVVAQDVLNTL